MKSRYLVSVDPATMVIGALLIVTLSRSVWQAATEGPAMELNPFGILSDPRFYWWVLFLYASKAAVQAMEPPNENSGVGY
jgi:hypothetical protein